MVIERTATFNDVESDVFMSCPEVGGEDFPGDFPDLELFEKIWLTMEKE